MIRILSLTSSVAVVACGGPTKLTPPPPGSSEASVATSGTATTKPPPSADEAQEPPASPLPVLDLSPVTYAWGGEFGPQIALDAQGYVSMSYDAYAFLPVPFGRLTAGGELIRDDGTTAATIDAAGLVRIEGRDMKLTISRDGTAHHSNGKLAFAINEDRSVSGPFGENGEVTTDSNVRYDGSLATRRAIIFATIMRTIWLGPDPSPESVSPSNAKRLPLASCDAYRARARKALACVKRDEIWTRWLREAIARVDGYASSPPAWGSESIAASCQLGATRLTAYFATKNCKL